MDYSWVPRACVPVGIAVVFAVFRKYFPARTDGSLTRYDRTDGKRLPTGVFNAVTIAMALLIAGGGYFVLHGLNRLFAKADGPALLQVFPGAAIWFFLPGFAALAIPWPLTIRYLRGSVYHDEAAYIEAEGSAKAGFDCYRVMVGMVLFLVVPIALFTLPALPERLTLTNQDIRWTHYASLRPEVFAYSDAQRALFVDGYRLRDGSFTHHPDLVLDFKDGRRLSANAVGDGGTQPSVAEMKMLLQKTGLTPQEVQTLEDVR